MGAVAATREPRQDRSRATRQRLLEAAVDCLAELGWARATVAVVAERAGVSRGAAQHHFPTREALFTAALEYMAAERIAEVRRCGAALPAGARHTEAVVEMLVGVYVGPLFRAAAQVWVQAAADEALRTLVVPLEARMARETHTIAVHLLGVDEGRPGGTGSSGAGRRSLPTRSPDADCSTALAYRRIPPPHVRVIPPGSSVGWL